MKSLDHAENLAASLTEAIACINNYLGDAFVDDWWRSAVDEYKASLIPDLNPPFYMDMLKDWEKTSMMFWKAGVDAPRHRVCAAHLRAIAERLNQHEEVSNLLKQEAMRAEGRA